MSNAVPLVTAEELAQFPDDDVRYELVEGRIVRMSPVGFAHGQIVLHLGAKLLEHVRTLNLGVVVTEVGFTLASNPDTVRAPDLAFIRRDRIPSPKPKGFWNGAPDLAVEVLSPHDRASEFREKAEEYLQRGAAVVVSIDPERRTVGVHRPSSFPVTLEENDVLDLGDVLPGFRCTVGEIFE